jgi:SAM-dependent methyltransferase
MRYSIREFIKIISEEVPIKEPIYEFGSLQVPGQEGFADMRPFFPGKTYLGFDYREGPGVDRIMDIHSIDSSLYGQAGTILCLDTMEHVKYPVVAMEEFHKILKPDGVVIVTSVMAFPIHSFPFDYWRFTPQGFQILFSKFNFSVIDSAGRNDFPHTVIGIGFKGNYPPLKMFGRRLNTWKEGLKDRSK